MSRPTKETDAKLKPCPFCGHPADFERVGTRRHSCIIACAYCGCRLETGEEGEHCGKHWNDRPAERQRDELAEALRDLMECHDEDVGMDDYEDSESVGTEYAPDGRTVVDMKLTFGVLRNARKALATKEGGV